MSEIETHLLLAACDGISMVTSPQITWITHYSGSYDTCVGCNFFLLIEQLLLPAAMKLGISVKVQMFTVRY